MLLDGHYIEATKIVILTVFEQKIRLKYQCGNCIEWSELTAAVIPKNQKDVETIFLEYMS